MIRGGAPRCPGGTGHTCTHPNTATCAASRRATRRNMSTGARAMSTALMLDADGWRDALTTPSGKLPDVSPSEQPPLCGGGDALDDRTRIVADMTVPAGEPSEPLAYEYRTEPGLPGARGDRNITKMAAEGWELTSRVPVSKKLEQVSFRRVKYQPPAGPSGMQYGPPQGPPWSPPQQVVQVKRRRGCIWWIGALVVALVAGGIIIAVTVSKSVPSTSGSHNIVMRVTGDGPAMISYGTTGGTSQETSPLPWVSKKTVNGFDVATIGAQRSGGGAGKINCDITIDGVVVAKEASSGAYAVVTCSGATP